MSSEEDEMSCDYEEEEEEDLIRKRPREENPFSVDPANWIEEDPKGVPPQPLPAAGEEEVLHKQGYQITEGVSYWNLVGIMVILHESVTEGTSKAELFNGATQRNGGIKFNW